jgi:IS5 family transposase
LRSVYRPPTPTTPSCCNSWSTPSRRSSGYGDALAVPRRRPAKLHADKGYEYPSCRRALRRRGITPRIARRGIESSQRLGRHRWTVERSLAWLLANRRVTVRYERRADLLMAFLHLACALTCSRKLKSL